MDGLANVGFQALALPSTKQIVVYGIVAWFNVLMQSLYKISQDGDEDSSIYYQDQRVLKSCQIKIPWQIW